MTRAPLRALFSDCIPYLYYYTMLFGENQVGKRNFPCILSYFLFFRTAFGESGFSKRLDKLFFFVLY